MVGVDDFAWTKRRGSGTILVDLETHRLLALLADCEGDMVAAWFRRHPSVQIVIRDRSPTFADARRCGAQHALHIADRFHLHMNAMTCLETLLTREQATLRRVAATLRAEHRKAHPAPLAIRHWPPNGNGASDGLVATAYTNRSSSGIRARLGASGDCAGNRVASANGGDLSQSRAVCLSVLLTRSADA